MPFLQVASKRLPLRPGQNVLGGSDADAPTGAVSPIAVIEVQADGSASIYATRMNADIRLDGIAVDMQPLPLKHGSKIEAGGRKLLYADERFTSGTNHIAGVGHTTAPVLENAMPSAPPSDSGGALIDEGGQRYAIPPSGLDIGRDPNCDVVIASNEVSRWHAQIAPGLMGYQLRDSSTNGVFVNGQRVHGERWLSIGDMIRIGAVQFRFEGEAASYEPDADRFDTGEMPAVVANTPLPPPSRESHDTVRISRSAVPTGPQAPLLATLEIINEGVLKGKRFRITRPLLHIGRGTHNEIILTDASVSSTHATLQRRGSSWFVVDADSTNGTYVDGERLTGERALAAVCELRFGGIKAVFRTVAGGGADDPSTKVVVGLTDAQVDPKRPGK